MEEPPFFLDAGNLALDLLNTLHGADGRSGDMLRSPAHLIAWLEAVGLASPTEPAGPPPAPPASRTLLTEARRLRDDVARIARSRGVGEPPPAHALYGVNRVLASRSVSSRLVVDDDGTRLAESETAASPLAILAPVARAAAELVVSADPYRLRRCSSEDCHRWFLDTSKGGRRKWCSMATCGNRAKAATHRNRRAIA